ncbi:hydroxylamine reductase [bacterium]|nr:hydroxylamine reductase [bacterium]
MYCYQCEQTAKSTACTIAGVCGKDATTAALQDVLVHVAKGVSMWAHRARAHGAIDGDVDISVVRALFTTITNVNFDPERLAGEIRGMVEMRERARKLYADAAGVEPEALGGPAEWKPADDVAALAAQAVEISIDSRKARLGEDMASLQEIITYGLKGAAAYVDHAHILGHNDDGIYASFHEALDVLTRDDATIEDLTGWAFKTGEINLRSMEILDAANTGTYGHPEPTKVRVTPVKGKAILVSGHDLKDLAMLLEQTAGKGINVYTHGEMLPTLAYPELKKYSHLVGNYGGAWQDQIREFDEFPGSILMTTNCIQKPRESYKGRIFTSGLVAWPGVTHIDDGDFSPVIRAALEAPGFTEDAHEHMITVGFGHNAVLSVAGTIVEAVKAGKIRHFFLVGGCDGAKSGRNYYTEFVEQVPDDCIVLTLACGKFRFNKMDLGDIGGIPRLLDIGQCNDAHSAVKIATALAEAFGCGVNDLPLSFILSWYEQKAVAILLSLLHLGIKGIRLGPTLPAFISPNVLGILVENFDIKPITTASEDLAEILG